MKFGKPKRESGQKSLFFRKQQHEVLGSHVKTLTKEKKEKENVMKNLELVNLKNVSLL